MVAFTITFYTDIMQYRVNVMDDIRKAIRMSNTNVSAQPARAKKTAKNVKGKKFTEKDRALIDLLSDITDIVDAVG